MPKAFSYIRFSTPEQARGDSLRRQLAKAHEWCDERGLELDDSLRDLGISAFKGANRDIGALGSFLALVQQGLVERGSILIVESLDRLSREHVLAAQARFLDLINAGIVIVTLADNQTYSTEGLRADPMPLIASIIVMMRAHEESKIKSERLGAVWAKKKAAARAEGRPLTSRCPEWLAIKGGKYIVREDRAEIVRSIFHMAVDGYGQRQIVARLNEANTPTWRGGQGWQTSTVSKILGGRLALGEYQPHSGTPRMRKPDGNPIPGYYPAIVSEEIYWRARQASQARRVAPGPRGRGVTHLLLGLGKCARCGGPMHVINKGAKPKGGTYFICSTSNRKAGCENGARWRVDQIESRLIRGISYLDAAAVLQGEQPSAEYDRVDLLQTQLAEVEERRARLLGLVEDGDEGATARYKALAVDANSLKLDLVVAEKEAATKAADPGLKMRLADVVELSRTMDEAAEDQRHAIRTRLAEQLRHLVTEVRYDPDLGVLAILTPRPGIAADDVPKIVGASKMQPWRVWLNDDSDPSGFAGFEDTPDLDEEARFLHMLTKFRGRRASS